MWLSVVVAIAALGLAFVAGMTFQRSVLGRGAGTPPRYLRMSIARWNIDLHSPEAEAIFRQIATDGVAVFRAQPGFVRYRLMRADNSTTIAVAEWESEELGRVGAENYRAWMRSVGIMDRFTLETRAGDIVAGS
jgi:heme-degrading monooxygenase HmoA